MKVGFAPSDALNLNEAEAEGFLAAWVEMQGGKASDIQKTRHIATRKKRKQ